MSKYRTRRVETYAERQAVVEDYQKRGYRVRSEGTHETVLRERDRLYFLMQLVTLFTIGIPSLGVANFLLALIWPSRDRVRVVEPPAWAH
ncbi:MAG: hypothetical protein ACLFSD_00100 [Salinivenus sp.]